MSCTSRRTSAYIIKMASHAIVDHDSCGVGFIAQLGSSGSREVVERALEALRRLGHRGGLDADGRSGDGAGLLTSIPEQFFRLRAQSAGISLPPQFGLGMVFLPADQQNFFRSLLAELAQTLQLKLLGWCPVPADPSILGPRAFETLPAIQQFFIAPTDACADLESRLFILRKIAESQIPPGAYFSSLSSRTVIYKGLLTPEQLPVFYPDLADPLFISSFAIFHQRYSTNTNPSWALAQPFRFIAHNGEINTINSNRRWMKARAPELLPSLGLPPSSSLLEEKVSDSASLDNAFEIFLRRGYSAAAAITCLVPPVWENDPPPSPALRSFLEGHAAEQEPWDGPAALMFTDGHTVGAKLDRNGLRPLRYILTSDGLLVAGSEVGIADFHGKRIIERQRLGPGEMLLVDPKKCTLLRPHENPDLKPWSKPDRRSLLPILPIHTIAPESPDATRALAAMGWSDDQYRLLFKPLVECGQEAVWSMGDDAPPAFLSDLARPLWDHCKQRFAQVTNPPIDPLREQHVMSLQVRLGGKVLLPSPLLDFGQLEALQRTLQPVLRLDFTFAPERGIAEGKRILDSIAYQAAHAADAGMILLSDRSIDAATAAVPALLALAAVWSSMVKAGKWNLPLVIETGQVVDTHHLALLIAAGASAVLPYAALQQARTLNPDGPSTYRIAVEKGLRKVMARMGISTLSSYRNSQLFETIGLDDDLRSGFFEGTGGALGGKSLDDILQDSIDRHTAAFSAADPNLKDLGLYRFRHNGERHAGSPELVRRMHRYIKSPSPENYAAFQELSHQDSNSIRDLMEIEQAPAIPLGEVEPASAVLSRFSTQAMSLGAISPEAHRTLAVAMNRLGARSNTGEGGEDPEVYASQPEANNRVKQVASGRFGVTTEYLVHADELEIKISQGAKPGEGGQLPAAKVTAHIARLRHAVPNMALISPPPHHDIYSIEDLEQLIYDLRAVNPRARIGVKLVSSSGVGIVAAGVAKAGADVITISGHDGGTGASPLTSIKSTGMPWEIGLRDAHSVLVRTGLRRRVRLRVDGGLKHGRDVIVAALLGADEFGFGTAALLAIGCVMARQCHLNTCPAGIATQDEKLRLRFTGKPEMVETYFRAVANEVRELLAAIGACSVSEIVGDVARLRPRDPHAALALGNLLDPTPAPPRTPCVREPDNYLRLELTRTIGELNRFIHQPYRFAITNADRAIGAHLSGEMLRRVGQSQMMTSVDCEFTGSAGQSFGAFLIRGINFRLVGEANDYVGKGLSGGCVSITAGDHASFRGDVLAGNAVLYGATTGELYIAGRAGERFAVRNSGALAVVEGVGQHGCEYMTAGVALILGPVGINFGAGMTGGVAYVLTPAQQSVPLNDQSVRIAPIEPWEEACLRRVLRKHQLLTGSPRAAELLRAQALPLRRVEPLALPCSIAETWKPILDAGRFHETLPRKLSQPVPPRPTAVFARRRMQVGNPL